MEILNDRTIKTAVLVLVLVATAYLVDLKSAGAQTIEAAESSPSLELNPRDPADAQALLAHIRAATRKACGNTDLEHLQYRLECLQMSYANALASFNSSHGIDLEAVAANAGKLAIARE